MMRPMSGPRSVRRHRVLVALPLMVTAVAIVSTVSAAAGNRLSEVTWLVTGGMIAFTTVGTLIEDRRPGQVVGRICLTIGVLFVLSSLLVLAAATLDDLPGRVPPLGAALAVIGAAIFSLVILLGGPLLISRFPDGREPGRSAILVDGLLAVAGATVLTGALRPGPIEFGWIEPVDNPLAIAAIPLLGSNAAFTVAFVAYGLASILACVGLVRRYVRGSSVVRAQIRWIAAAIGISVVLLVLLFLTTGSDALNGAVWRAWILSFLLPPIAIGIAILRYRLYDIDQIISNAIGYGLVSLVLVGAFIVVNLGLQGVLSPITRSNPLAVAASTLLVAVSFNPLRRRIQRVVDRRFHRARYDAEQTVAGLAGRLRDEVDMARLRQEIIDVVARSFEPTDVHLWLRPGSAR